MTNAVLPEIVAFTDHGGTLQNFDPVQDPTTDINDTADNAARANAAATTHTLFRAWVKLTMVALAAPTLQSHDAVWGSNPIVAPVLARTSIGLFTITWPTSVVDEIIPIGGGVGGSHTVNFRGASRPNVWGSTLYHANATVTAANVITFRVWDTTNALTDAAGATLELFGF